MKDYQQRVVDEKRELDEKIVRLAQFRETAAAYTALHTDERERLTAQLFVMRQYSSILAFRIAAFQ